jgi:hypothetical protein
MTTISKFLHGYTIKVSAVPAYVEFNNDWTTHVDKELARIILESPDGRFTPEMKEHFRKTYDLIDPRTNELKVHYRPRKDLGRRYPEEPSHEFYSVNGEQRRNMLFGKYWGNLTIHSKYIKNTIFHYQGWVDYDQRKGHPTILFEVASRNGITLTAYQKYIREGGFEGIVDELRDWYSADEENPLTDGDIKDLFNRTIYGGGHYEWCKYITHENLSADEVLKLLRKGKFPKEMKNKKNQHSFYKEYLKDTQLISKLIWDANPELRNKVCAGMPDDSDQPFSRMRNTLMSYFCGIIENELTFRAYKYCVTYGLCPAKKVEWGYDGFTTPPPPPQTDHDFHLNAMNEEVRAKTGFKMVTFIRKAFKPDTIVQSVLDERRNMVVAEIAVGAPIILAEAVNAPPEPSNDDEAYLVWKEGFEKDWCKIKNTASFLRICKDENGDFEKYVIQTEKQLITAYKHQNYNKEVNGKTKKICCVKEWLEDENMLCYEDVDLLPPPLRCPRGVLNMWRPSPFENRWDFRNPDTAYEYDEEGVRMFCEHVQILCNHNEEVFNYVMAWLAHMFQFPAEKTTHLVFVSEEGAGKNIFIETLGDLLGKGKVLSTSTPERDVWGSFNSLMLGAFLINLNEVDKRNSKSADGKFKELVTEKQVSINSKGKDAFVARSSHRFITTTNTEDPQKTHTKDRRNIIIRSSDEKVGDFSYFKTLSARLKNDVTLRSIYCCFMKTDLTDWDFRQIPRTDYHKIIIDSSRKPLDIFMEHFTIIHRDRDSVEYYGKDLLSQFRSWKEEFGYSFDDKMSDGTLVKRLLLELKLPDGCMEKLGRSSKGIKRLYRIDLLRIKYKVPPSVTYQVVNHNHIVAENGNDVEEEDDGVETETEEEQAEEEDIEN